ncbi:zinc ribbon domain-containing protein [Aquifex aeolicus]|uniref:C4-type zinc ribbon domain-containing protein n=1 Tax=Aquifex aeolicus (strain VF5) TaxID=224324 RepID=O67273_AQUAE|nr:zinc ribbon domain-containing protein [Aquifex aeolicus]AAC07236.1 putative protein [Aquifex aeolicus VF5]
MTKEEAKLLVKIQEIDLETERVNHRLKKIEEEVKKLKEELEALLKEKETLLKRKEELENLKKQLQEEVKEAEEKLKVTEEKLMKVTRDVEYKALLREKSKLEDKILKKSYEIDQIEEELEKITKEIEEKVPRIERQVKEIEEELKDLELEESIAHRKIHEYVQKREEVKREIPEHLLKFYEENKKHFEGLVIVPTEDEACAGCGIKIPSVLLSKMIKEDSIEQCPSCGRFVYYKL